VNLHAQKNIEKKQVSRWDLLIGLKIAYAKAERWPQVALQ
jgi:hypothetical protein